MRNIFHWMEKFHVSSNFYKLLLTNFLRFILIRVSFKEENVSLKFCFRCSSVFNNWCFSQAFSFIFPISQSQSTICMHRRRMSKPSLKTNPAKFMLAISASHVLTPLIFFNIYLTFWTRFTIKLNVINIGGIFLFFITPVFKLFTWCWKMSFFITCKTETISTFTVDVGVGTEIGPLDQFVAELVGTPLNISVSVCEITTVPVEVLFFKIDSIFNDSIQIF